MRYNKYKNAGAIHWDWYYKNNPNYKRLVDESIIPLYNLKKGVVLDIGSGDGLVDYLLIKQGHKVIGVEPDPYGNKIAKKKVKGMELKEKTLQRYDKKDNDEYNYLYCLNTIEHIEEPELVVKHMRKAKLGVVVTDNKDKKKEKGSLHYKEFNMKELKEMFNEFEIEEMELSNSNFIGIIIKNYD